jgi:hypothetical protein
LTWADLSDADLAGANIEKAIGLDAAGAIR